MEYHDDTDDLLDSIGAYIADVRRTDWEVYGALDGTDEFPEWFDRLQAVASRSADDADEVLREEFQQVTEEAKDVFVDE
jgi:CRISPR-associated protein Csc2